MYLVQRVIYYHKVNFSLKRLNQAKIVKNSCMSIIKKQYRFKKKESIFVSIYRLTGKL